MDNYESQEEYQAAMQAEEDAGRSAAEAEVEGQAAAEQAEHE